MPWFYNKKTTFRKPITVKRTLLVSVYDKQVNNSPCKHEREQKVLSTNRSGFKQVTPLVGQCFDANTILY